MKEFMLIIRTQGDHLKALPADQQQQHLEKVMNYIGGLMKSEKLNSAQPLEMEGTIISGSAGKFKDGPFNPYRYVIMIDTCTVYEYEAANLLRVF